MKGTGCNLRYAILVAMSLVLCGCAHRTSGPKKAKAGPVVSAVELSVRVVAVVSNRVELVTRTRNVSPLPITFAEGKMPGHDPSYFSVCAYRLIETKIDTQGFNRALIEYGWGPYELPPAASVEQKVSFVPPFRNVGQLDEQDLALFWHWRLRDAVRANAGGPLPVQLTGAVLIPKGSARQTQAKASSPPARVLEVSVSGKLRDARKVPIGEGGRDWIVPFRVTVKNVTGQSVVVDPNDLPWNSAEFHVVIGFGTLGLRADRYHMPLRRKATQFTLFPGATVVGSVDVELLNDAEPKSNFLQEQFPLFWVWNLRKVGITPVRRMPELLGGSVELLR
jgi:hypothetical protein